MEHTVKGSSVNINLSKVQRSKEFVGNQRECYHLDLNLKNIGGARMIGVRIQMYGGSDEIKGRYPDPALRLEVTK